MENTYTLKGYLSDGTIVISCRHCFLANAAEEVIRSAWLTGIAYTGDGRVLWANPRRINDIELIPYDVVFYRPF